jgi:hypothetical protein
MLPGFFFGSFFDPKDEGDVPPKPRLTFNSLNGIISFITTVYIIL